MIHVIDTEQRIRAARPTEYGLSPFVAERLQGFGIDPRDHMERLREREGVFASSGARLMPLARAGAAAAAQELALDYADVTQREILDHAAAEVEESGFLAEQLVPTALVDSDKGNFPVDDYAESIEQVDDAVGTHGDVNRVHTNHSFIPYTTGPHALETRIPRALVGVAPKLVSVVRSTQKLSGRLKRNHEVRVATLVSTSTNFAASCRRVLGAGQNWNGGASADPIADMHAMLAAMLVFPNTSVFSLEAFQAVQANDTMRAILASQLSNDGILRPADWSRYWGIARTLISESRTKAQGSATLARIYPTTSFSLLHVNASEQARTFAKNFTLRGGAMGWTTLTWFEPKHGNKGADCVKTGYDNDIVIIDSQFGAICTGMRA